MLRSITNTPSMTPLNEEVGSRRRFDWLEIPLSDVKTLRKTLDCTVNDVVLAAVTGAVREFLLRRGTAPEGLDFRIGAPVSIRKEGERGQLGNRVSQWFVPVPLSEGDPRKRVEQIRNTTRDLKESKQALDADSIMGVAEWTPTILLSLAGRAAAKAAPYNLMVTNVPGPQFPLYLQGAKLVAQYPQVPLAPRTALGIALVSYDGKLCWGFNADYNLVPDLAEFVQATEHSFRELGRACGVDLARNSARATE